MPLKCRHGGWTLLETVIVLGILACLFIMLLPAILASRETARRLTCADNLKIIGLGIHNYGVTYKLLPASATLDRGVDGRIKSIAGPSLMSAILPYMEGIKRLETPTRPATQFPWLLCPSYGGSPWADSETQNEAITNYRPLGATHIESLSVASPNPMPQKLMTLKYLGKKAPHPDGVCFPESYRTFGSIRTGFSNTAFVAESLEPRFARWAVGGDSAMVGLPRNVEFEEWKTTDGFGEDETLFARYYIPKGYSDALKGRDDSIYWFYQTYLDWDYDSSPYDGEDGSQSGKYGPSSNHSGVNHLFGDASARMLNRKIDIGIYQRLIMGRY